jgi:hypothetical protein
VSDLKKVVLHPALMFAAGNTFLAFSHAEIIGISLNVLLVLVILLARLKEVIQKRHFGVPFAILAIVNFVTAGSVIYKNINSPKSVGLIRLRCSSIILGLGHWKYIC